MLVGLIKKLSACPATFFLVFCELQLNVFDRRAFFGAGRSVIEVQRMPTVGNSLSYLFPLHTNTKDQAKGRQKLDSKDENEGNVVGGAVLAMESQGNGPSAISFLRFVCVGMSKAKEKKEIAAKGQRPVSLSIACSPQSLSLALALGPRPVLLSPCPALYAPPILRPTLAISFCFPFASVGKNSVRSKGGSLKEPEGRVPGSVPKAERRLSLRPNVKKFFSFCSPAKDTARTKWAARSIAR